MRLKTFHCIDCGEPHQVERIPQNGRCLECNERWQDKRKQKDDSLYYQRHRPRILARAERRRRLGKWQRRRKRSISSSNRGASAATG